MVYPFNFPWRSVPFKRFLNSLFLMFPMHPPSSDCFFVFFTKKKDFFCLFSANNFYHCFRCRLCSTKLLTIPQLIRQFHRICNRMAMHPLLIINLIKFNNSRTIPQMAEFREHGKVQTPWLIRNQCNRLILDLNTIITVKITQNATTPMQPSH